MPKVVNKVEYNGNTLIDLTEDTVTPQTLLQGATAHSASGQSISGSVDLSTKADKVANATANDLAKLDASGNLVDSGIAAGDVATASDVEKADITGKVNGADIALTDSADARVQDLRIYGRTESGASVGDNGLTVTSCGKNLLYYDDLSTAVINGVTFEPQSDGGIYVHGETSTTYASYKLIAENSTVSLSEFDDKLLTITGSTQTHIRVQLQVSPWTAYADCVGNEEKIIDYGADIDLTKKCVVLMVPRGKTVDEIVYPMIRGVGSSNYTPYTGSTATITTALPLRSNGDVKDEIDFADGQAITRIDSNGDVLATPVITPLSATEITAFRALRTFDSVTNITATDDPYMSVTYIKNTANGEAVGAIEDDLQGQITVLNTAKQPKTLDTPITIGGTSRTTVETALGALNTAKEDAITQSATLTLTVAGWDSTLKTQTVTYAHNTTKRNVIDITVSALEDWAECGVLPTGETNAGISFKCEEIPESDLTFKVTSMGVTT